jgi:tetratricopeptide (TPR) repeat protein
LIFRGRFCYDTDVRGAVVTLLSAAFVLSVTTFATAQTTEADVYVAQAIIELDDRQYDQALDTLRRALEIEPNHVEALYYTGVAHMARREPDLAIPFLERARARSPRDASIAFQLALAYVSQQQYDRAKPLLEEVFAADPTLDGLGYYVGFVRYREKDYRGALAAFRAGRSSDPEIQQLTRFYSALALASLGLPSQAASEVEQALRLAPGSSLTGPAERLRDTIGAARSKERRLSAEARVGLSYDSNVVVRPDANSSEPLTVLLRDRKHASVVELFGLRLDYTFYRTDQWEASAGYSFFATYVNDLPTFNGMDHLGNVALIHKTVVASLPVQVGLQYAFDDLFLDEAEFLKRHSVTVSAAVVESERHLTQAFVRFQDKDFAETVRGTPRAEDRDARNWLAGFLHLIRFAQDRHFLKVGYQFDYDDTEGSNYEYLGNRVTAGAQYTLPWYDIRLKYDFDVHLRRYRNRNTILPSTAPGTIKRKDDEYTHNVRVELPIAYSPAWACGPWGSVRERTEKCLTLSADYLYSDVHSNVAIFDFKRNVFSLILSWSY